MCGGVGDVYMGQVDVSRPYFCTCRRCSFKEALAPIDMFSDDACEKKEISRSAGGAEVDAGGCSDSASPMTSSHEGKLSRPAKGFEAWGRLRRTVGL